jgi:hypothetical protein
MSQTSIVEQPCQHRERTRREHLIDVGFLPFQSFDGGTARQRVFSCRRIDDLGIEFADGAESRCAPPVAAIRWLSEEILPTGRIVSQIEPLSKRFFVYV